jgi:spermidine synthase
MSATPTPVNHAGATTTNDLPTALALALCFALSGVAALIYQTAWTRQFALVFGTSELAVATVLAAYMGGLALGAWLAQRWLPRITRPVLTYAGLELGIGASAVLLVPALLLASDALLRNVFGGQSGPPDSAQTAISVFYLISAFVALAVPTVLMGATLPLLARHAVHTEAQIGRRIGMLYAMNTAGAVVGALVTAFWLLPNLGLTNTVRTGAAINFVVFLLAAGIAKRLPTDPQPATGALQTQTAIHGFTRVPSASWVLPLMLLSGAVAFFHEVLWTRMLSHVMGSSVHAFGVMVASFLGGIAIGGAIGALLARNRTWSVRALALSQIGCAATAALAYLLLNDHIPERRSLLETSLFGAMILMPLTLFIGTTYPLAVRILAERPEDAASVSARVYAWNTVGAIVGALAAGFVLIPWLRFEGSVQLAVISSAVLGIACLWLLQTPPRVLGAAVTVVTLVAVAFFRPGIPDSLIRSSPLYIANHGEIAYYDVGRSASVVVLKQDGGLALRTNGLPEALMEMSGTSPRFSGEFWLSPIAVIARPATRNMLIVGFGGGVVIENVPASVASVDVIELEPLVIEANRATRGLRKRDPLSDHRVNLISNDARGALGLTDKRYDAIVSQPSHPWTAGASHLYTLEFMQQARDHLTEGGVFVQWMNVNFVNEPLLRSLTATLLHVFPNVRIYRPDPATLVFLASSAPFNLEQQVAATGLPLSNSPRHYSHVGINVAEDLVAALAVDERGARSLAAGAPLITDDDNRLAMSTVFELQRGLSNEQIGRLLGSYDPLRRPDSFIYREMRDRLAFDYIARRQITFIPLDASIGDRLLAMARVLGNSADGYVVRILTMTAGGQGIEARRVAREALSLFPEDDRLRFEFLRPSLGSLAEGKAPAEVVDEAARFGEIGTMMMNARRHGVRAQWSELARMDRQLAQVPWTDPWKFDAIHARADWRGRVSTPSERVRLGDEGIAILDPALVISPTLSLYSLRARCAMAAGRGDVLVESLWTFGQATYLNALRDSKERREAMLGDLENILEVLDREAKKGGADPARVTEVRARLVDAISRLRKA